MTLEQHNNTLDERAPRLSEKEAKLIGLLEALQEKYDTLAAKSEPKRFAYDMGVQYVNYHEGVYDTAYEAYQDITEAICKIQDNEIP